MIVRLALREMWHSRLAILLQVAGLMIAIAALAASSQLNAQLVGGAVPGSECAEDVLQVVGIDGSGNTLDGWTPRQSKALIEGLKGFSAAQWTYGSIRLRNGLVNDDAPAAFVGREYFNVLCVARRDGLGRPLHDPFVSGAVADRLLADSLPSPRTVISNANALTVESTTTGFKGLQYKAAPVQVWAPYAELESQGDVFANLDSGVIHVIVRPQPGQSTASLDERLEAVRLQQPGLFSNATRVQAGPALQVEGWTADKIRLVARILGIFAWALILLVLTNLLVYNAGRLAGTHVLATIMAAVGATPASITRYSAIEPVLVGVVALVSGCMLSVPLGYASLAAVSSDSTIDLATTWSIWLRTAIVAALIVGSLVLVRSRVLNRRQAPSRSRARRGLLRLLPWLLTLQVALAALTLTLAAQSAVGLYKAVPPEPKFSLTGLSVVTINKRDTSHTQEHVALRWRAAWQSSPNGYKAALATSQTPFLPATGYQGGIRSGDRATQALFDFVTSDFFEVVGGNAIQAREFDADTNSWKTSGNEEGTHLVLNADAAQSVGLRGEPSGAAVRINHDIAHEPSVENRSAVVLGVFDDGLIGAQGAVGTMELSKLSMQGSVPVVYQSLTELRPDDQLFVFVRHPPTATKAQISAAVLPAVRVLLPRATISQIDDGRTLFRNPLRKERSMALILGLLAAATLAIGLLGMIALMAMLLDSLKVELAVRYAIGSTRRTAALQIARRLATPAAIGMVVAVAPAAFGLTMLSQTLETTARASAWGPAIAAAALGIAVFAVLVQASRRVLGANFMDWLRYE